MWSDIKVQVTLPPEKKNPEAEIDWFKEVQRAKREAKIKTRVAKVLPLNEIWRTIRVPNITDVM